MAELGGTLNQIGAQTGLLLMQSIFDWFLQAKFNQVRGCLD